MIKVLIFLIVGVLLGLGVPVFLKEWGILRPGQRKPRPNFRRTWVKQIAIPVGAAMVLCLLAWAGLSLLFSSTSPEKPTVSNSVTKPIQPAGTEAADKNVQPAGTPASPKKPAGKREPLVATTPLAKAAVGALPVATQMDRVGLRLGRKYASTLAVKKTEAQPETPAEPKPAVTPEPAPPPKPNPETTPAPPPATPEPQPASTPEPKPETAPKKTPGVEFTVHLASFTEEANAQRSLAKLKSAGVPAFVSRIELDNKVWHRLMAGRFPSRAEAEAYGRQLKAKGLTEDLGEFRIKPIVTSPGSG